MTETDKLCLSEQADLDLDLAMHGWSLRFLFITFGQQGCVWEIPMSASKTSWMVCCAPKGRGCVKV